MQYGNSLGTQAIREALFSLCEVSRCIQDSGIIALVGKNIRDSEDGATRGPARRNSRRDETSTNHFPGAPSRVANRDILLRDKF